MKNSSKNLATQKNAFTKFSTVALNQKQQKKVKGGSDGDIIIVEELIIG